MGQELHGKIVVHACTVRPLVARVTTRIAETVGWWPAKDLSEEEITELVCWVVEESERDDSPPAGDDLKEAKRIMERLVKMPPKPHDSDKQDKKEKPDD